MPARLWSLPRPLLFLVNGGLNTAFGYGVYAVCIWAKTPIWAAVAISTVLGVLFNYLTSKTVVFRGAPGRPMRFALTYLCVYLTNTAMTYAAHHAGASALLAGLLALPPAVAISWILQSKWVFAPSTPSPHKKSN